MTTPRPTPPSLRRSVARSLLLSFILLPSSLCLPSCTSDGDPKPSPTTKTSEAALKDPFGKWSSDVNTDISGGGSNNLNRDAMKRDLDNFWLK